MDFGHWEMRRWDDIPRVEIDAWRDALATYRIPGGETVAEVSARATAFVAELAATDRRRHLVVTHGGVIRCLVNAALGRPPEQAFRVRAAYGSVTRIVYRPERASVETIVPAS